MARKEALKKYRQKRDFGQTPEPLGAKASAGAKTGSSTRAPAKGKARPLSAQVKAAHRRVFAVQLHRAKRLHYDFRLEIDGVLKSWAIPKGPSMNPADKRLAVMTEDHPLEYAAFEGIIPEGNYGAGEVIVWDGGVYENLKLDKDGNEVSMDEACDKGHFTIMLHGRKLRGGFALTRTRIENGKQSWILVKMRDQYASNDADPVRDRPRSILSRRTVQDVAEQARHNKKAVPKWRSAAA